MSELARHYDWSASPLGKPDQWSQSLRTLVNMMLTSRFPMLIFWGPQLITFYNDAFRPSLGDNGKHPSSLGQKGEQSWAESWPVIGPMIYNIMAGGEAVWFEDQKLPLYRDGQMGYAYWTYSFSPLTDDTGAVNGVLVTCSETTKAVLTRQRMEESELFSRDIIDHSPVAKVVFTGQDMIIQRVNQNMLAMLGRDISIIGKPFMEAMPELIPTPLMDRLRHVLATNETYYQPEEKIMLIRFGQPYTGYFNYIYKALTNAAGERYGIVVTATEVTQQVLARQQIEASEAQLRRLMENTPDMIARWDKDRRLLFANSAFAAKTGAGYGWLPGKTDQQMGQPEVIAQPYMDQLQRVLDTGQFLEHRHSFTTPQGDVVFQSRLVPEFTPDGRVESVLAIDRDITQEVKAQQHLSQQQQQVLTSFEQAPVGIAIISGGELIFQMANPFYSNLVGRSSGQLVGKPFLKVMPELEGQGFDHLLHQVIATGEPFIASEIAVDIVRQGQMETIFVDLAYQPWRESTDLVSGVLVVATDVTQQVRSRKAVESSAAQLRSLVESAPFPIGVYVGSQMQIQLANQSILDVWGKGYDVIGRRYADILPELANQQIFSQLDGVYSTGIPFHARKQRVDLVVDGHLQPYYFNYSFTPLRDGNGQVYGVMNTAAEITDLVLAQQALEVSEARYRDLSAELEQQVQERTEELEVANEELAANNEELAANNEELEEANGMLIRSNDNLQTFAYVASHDLQEPLRKIQQFGDLLRNRQSTLLGEELLYIERMQAAASRMSSLIRDLLAFSRISTQRETNAPVSLATVINTALTDLELVIQETGAAIHIDALPTVQGDPLQLEQLFLNLLSNALKFRKPGTAPLIHISEATVSATDLPASVKPARAAGAYYRIAIADNGIGFDEKYLDRIFQIFQRLHGKGEFAGTGIGLAICQRVVVNHGGAITASSQSGQGATFSVYLPV